MLSIAEQIDLFILQQESRMRPRSSLFTGYVSRERYVSPASPSHNSGVTDAAEPASTNPIVSPRDAEAGKAPLLALVDTINEAHSVSSRFTEAEQLALLIARGSDFAKLCAYAMKARGAVATNETYKTLVSTGLAIPAGNFHNLTPRGRWIANIVAREVAPKLGIEVETRFVRRRGSFLRGVLSQNGNW